MEDRELEQKIRDLASNLRYQTDRDLEASGLSVLRCAKHNKGGRIWAIACAVLVVVGLGAVLPIMLNKDTGYHEEIWQLELAGEMSSVEEFNQTYQTHYLSLINESEVGLLQVLVYKIEQTGEFACLEENFFCMTDEKFYYSILDIKLAEIEIPFAKQRQEQCNQTMMVGQTAVSFAQNYNEEQGGYISYATWVYDNIEYTMEYFSLTEQDFFDELNRLLGQVEASA